MRRGKSWRRSRRKMMRRRRRRKRRKRMRSGLLFLLLGWTVAYFCFFKSYMDIECGRQRTLQAAKSQNNPETNRQMKI